MDLRPRVDTSRASAPLPQHQLPILFQRRQVGCQQPQQAGGCVLTAPHGPAGLRGQGLRALGQRAVPAGAQLHAVAAAARERVLQRPQLQAARARRQRVPMFRGASPRLTHLKTLFWVPQVSRLGALLARGSKCER